MSRRMTLERVLRDNDDHSGQTIREWRMELSDGHVSIRRHEGGDFIMLRIEDVEQFVEDITTLAGV